MRIHRRTSASRNCPLFMMAAWLAAALLGGAANAAGQERGAMPNPAPPPARASLVKGGYGTYNAPPRKADGRVNLEALAADLASLKATTYNWLIWHAATDWDDLQAFLPLAAKAGLQVWVTLVPPSESPPKTRYFSEPFRLDYDRWAKEIAELSLKQPALVAWSIDDFLHNLKEFTPARVQAMAETTRRINPRLAFVPCCYFKQVSPRIAKDYGPWLDGLLLPYRHELVKADLVHADTVEAEVARLRELMGPSLPIIVDVYATRHSSLGDSTPAYVKEVMTRARACADGVLIYCHQHETRNPEKYAVIKDLFHRWEASRSASGR